MIKWTNRWLLLATLIVGFAFFSAQAASAATVTAILEPGRLTITDAPVALTYSSATTADNLRFLDATFSLGVTDATGKRAGWHIQATLGALMRADGTSVLVRASTVTEARITTRTGLAPQSIFSYPHALRANGDTIFSAASGSGAGKSSLTFGTELAIMADAEDTTALTATLTVTVTPEP